MAEALVSSTLEQLFSILCQRTVKGTAPNVGVDKEVEKLTDNLLAIQAVVKDAEQKQVEEEAVRDWLQKLKNSSSEVNNVLDKWSTIISKLQLKDVENDSKPLSKVCSLESYYLYCAGKFALNFQVAGPIKKLNKKLANVAKDKDRFKISSLSEGIETLNQPIPSPVKPNLYGRDHAKEELEYLLLQKNWPEKAPPIIPIVGIDGIGKTTFARFIFNDDKIQAHFEIRIWVCVSRPFNVSRIAKAILECLTNKKQNLVELEIVLQNIGQYIKGKKFLLVLDDLWIEEVQDNWRNLMECLKLGSTKSRVLVTSRKKKHAKEIKTNEMVILEKLSDEECESLFKDQVPIIKETNERCKKLGEIGSKIVKKCNGLPLAIKMVGNLLSIKTEIKQWNDVLENEVWELEDIEKGVFPYLLLCYYDLPSKLKRCFLYCAIFPKNYEINKSEMIKLWMAQDYLKVEGMDDMELIGEKYFENLRMKSFLEDIEISQSDSSITQYKMHNIVHDFAQSLATNECFLVDAERSVKHRSKLVHKNAQHLMILGNSIPNSSYTKKKLRSLIVDSEFEFGVNLSTLFDQLTYLRSLDLSYCSCESLSTEISKLIHLRYLKLSENRYLKELPESLCRLYNLQTLDLTKCVSLQKLPNGIDRLMNLRYLKNVKTYSLSYMPKGMERLTCLRELSEFIRSSGGRGHDTLECLGNMDHLQGSLVLRRLGNEVSAEEAEKAKLNVKKNLTDLSLSFYKLESLGKRKSEQDNIVLNALQPPLNLEKLRIDEYDCKSLLPPWLMSLSKLKMLTLYSCMNLEQFPDPLGKLPSLESLNIRYNNGLRSINIRYMKDWEENLRVQSNQAPIVLFPKLKNLTIKYMEEWEDWECDEKSLEIMPELCSLELVSCPKLKGLPSHILFNTRLEKLAINHCSIIKIEIPSCKDANAFSNLRVITLGGCLNCEKLPPLGKLPSLESLFIKFMEGVETVGDEFLGIEGGGNAFPKLKTLEFEDMTEWKIWDITITTGQIMPCLRSLTIKLCDKLKHLPICLSDVKTLEAFNMYNCRILRQFYKKKKGDGLPKFSSMTSIKVDDHCVQNDDNRNTQTAAPDIDT